MGREHLRKIDHWIYSELGFGNVGVEESQGVNGTRDAGKCIINPGDSEVRAGWRGRS